MNVDTGPGAPGCRAPLSLQMAIEEAHRCLLCHDAPCSARCPAGTDPARFIRKIRFYNLKGAARTVLSNNPLGGVCGHLCPTEETCRAGCARAGLDRPIDIDGLQRFAVEYGRRVGLQVLERGPAKKQRVAIVGAGPAGLAAAAVLAQLGYAVTVFEARPEAGGMLRYGVPAHRLPTSALGADLAEILELGVELRTNAPVAEDAGKLLDQGFDAVFVAPGLWRPHMLSVPGADLEGVSSALDFLALSRANAAAVRRQVEGRNVAIVGGGSVAMDVASTARALGAKKVYAIALEAMTELPANEAELEDARKGGLILKPQCMVTKIVGEEGQVVAVEGVETEWIEPGKPVPSNARAVPGTTWRIAATVLVQAIGQGLDARAGQILSRADKSGPWTKAEPSTRATSLPRVFAGGDVIRGPATVVQAVDDGKRAARAIDALFNTGAGPQAPSDPISKEVTP